MKKKNLSISVSENILEQFKQHCDENSINRSDLVEKWIIKYLDGKGENETDSI